MISLPIALALQAAEPVSEDDLPPVEEQVRVLRQLAFDPSKLGLESDVAQPVLYARYGGDDWGFPVYAFAFQWDLNHCRNDSCEHGWRARMVRAPAPPDTDPASAGFRSRWRGVFGLRLLYEAQERNGDLPISEIVAELPLQRVQASSENCDADILPVLAGFDDATWIDRDLRRDSTPLSAPQEEIYLSLHADTMEVSIDSTWQTLSTAGMVPRNGTIARWTDDLVDALEPCWLPIDGVPAD